ncbi:BTB And Kelch [Ostertagia ostertagi]
MVDVDATTLDALVTFCYTGKIKITESNLLIVITGVARRTLARGFILTQPYSAQKYVCGEFMMRLLHPSNCLGIRAFADTYACQELLRCADKYISHKFKDVVHAEEFLQLSADRLIEVISCDKLRVRSENQVFTAVLEWVRFDLAARKQFLPRVLEHVRLSFCQPEFLADTISKDELVMTNVTCRNFVDEAKAGRNYLLLQLFTLERPNVEAPRIRPRVPFKCKKVLYVGESICSSFEFSYHTVTGKYGPRICI